MRGLLFGGKHVLHTLSTVKSDRDDSSRSSIGKQHSSNVKVGLGCIQKAAAKTSVGNKVNKVDVYPDGIYQREKCLLHLRQVTNDECF